MQEKKPTQAHYGSSSLLMAAASIINEKKVTSLLNITQGYWLTLVSLQIHLLKP